MRRHDKSARVFNFDKPLFVKEELVEAVTEEPKAPAAPQVIPPWEDFPQGVLDAHAEEWSKLPAESGSVTLYPARGGVSSGGTVESTGHGPRLHTESKTRPSITLRWYQNEAIKRIFEEWDSGNNSTLLVLPTGCGKTITFGSVVYRFSEHYGPRKDGSPRRSLILAHRTELITQACDSLAVLGVEAAIEQASQKARAGIFGDPTCVVASVQSMQANERSKRLLGWDPDYFDLIITDEGHHAAGDPSKRKGKKKGKLNTYQQIYNHFTGAVKKLFVTATPDRADGENMGSICDSLAFEYPMYDAVREGWLCPIRIRWCDTGVDLRNIRTTGGDLNENDIAEAIKPHIEVLARATKREIDDRKTLVFCPDVGSAEAFASAMESLGIKSASLSGESSDQERQDVLNAFRRGDIQLLANCGLFTEGFDVPSIACVVLLRPTKSRPLYCQMVGRGTRPAPGKENLVVVDFPWVAGKHKLVKPTELFDSTKQSEERYKEAEKLLERGETDDLMAAMQMADEVIKEKVKLRIKVTEGRVKYRKTEYDPLAVGDILGIPHRQESEGALKKRITDKQLEILRKAKIVNAESMSASRASLYVDKVIDRWRNDKASIPQVSYLIALGVEPEIAREMGFKEASATIGRLKAARGQ
jgi:superfamily II DNA or RNA helicase